MSVIIKAHFDGKTIVPDSEVDLPPDQPLEVEVRLLPKKGRRSRVSKTVGKKLDITSLPFFGMWADREDIKSGAEWVRKERENWSNRHFSAGS